MAIAIRISCVEAVEAVAAAANDASVSKSYFLHPQGMNVQRREMKRHSPFSIWRKDLTQSVESLSNSMFTLKILFHVSFCFDEKG